MRKDNAEKTLAEIKENHFSYLTTVKNSEKEAKSSLLYSYKHTINGFSALLTPDEANKLSGKLSMTKWQGCALILINLLFSFYPNRNGRSGFSCAN